MSKHIKNLPRCYESHPDLVFTDKQGVKIQIAGGSCVNPLDNHDVYIGLDFSMSVSETQYPWTDGVEFLYPIVDQQVPKNVESFKKLINWTQAQLSKQKKVHVGCIGGHGRTGLVFAALYAQMTGKKDAIQYVREHYCKKAVETKVQVKFLMQHYGTDTAEVSKPYVHHTQKKIGYGYSTGDYYDMNKYFPNSTKSKNGKKDFIIASDYDDLTITPDTVPGHVF